MSTSFPSLNLRLGDFNHSAKEDTESVSQQVIVRTDSELRKHKISILISEQEVGEAEILIDGKSLKVLTYQMKVSDDKTEETTLYQVIRDQPKLLKKKTKKSWLSFLGITWFDKEILLYENLVFEPQKEELEHFQLSKYRQLKEDFLVYQLENSEQKVFIIAGNPTDFMQEHQAEHLLYFRVIDNVEGQSFLGDIRYREQTLKLTPKVELTLVKRKKVPQSMEYEKGQIEKIIYL